MLKVKEFFPDDVIFSSIIARPGGGVKAEKDSTRIVCRESVRDENVDIRNSN